MDAYSETLNKIYSLRGGEIDLRLDRMSQALSLFDHPENKFPSLHIAGTNGKGSTAAMLHRILSLAGYRTALYTSPHLVSFTERIRIGDEEIAPDDVVALAEEIWGRAAAADIPLTFFEFITVLAFIYFARQQVIERLQGVDLPTNIQVRFLPDMALARNYPTIGPSGPARLNVNGLATSLEFYFGRDVLATGRRGTLMPVQWRGYNQPLRRYHGELLDKRLLRQRFDAKVDLAL